MSSAAYVSEQGQHSSSDRDKQTQTNTNKTKTKVIRQTHTRVLPGRYISEDRDTSFEKEETRSKRYYNYINIYIYI